MDIDKKRDIERTDRYYKLNLSGKWSSTGTNPKISFTIPPLNSSGFAYPSKNECIIKIRKVYIDVNETRNNCIFWGVIGATGVGDVLPYTNGITLASNIMSRNTYFLQGNTQDQEGIGGKYQGGAVSRLGAVVRGENNEVMSDGTIFLNGTIRYEDFSNISESGVICSNPFGQTVEFWIAQATEGSLPMVPYYNTSGPDRWNDVYLKVELEVYVL